MRTSQLRFVYLSIFVAYLAFLLPCSGWVLRARPDFVLLVLIYWLIRAPHLCNIGTAWLIGLLVDLTTGSVFGMHALTYTVTAFFAVVYQRRLVLFNPTQKLIYVFFLLVIAQAVFLMLKLFSGADSLGWHYFLPSITGMLVWMLAQVLGANTSGALHKP